MSIKKKIIKDTFFYSTATLFSQGLLLVKNCLVANILMPVNFGFWKFLQLLSEYGVSSNVALIEGLRQKVPAYAAGVDKQKILHTRDAAFSFTVFLSICYFTVSFIIYLFIFKRDFISFKKFPTNLLLYLLFINFLTVFAIIYAFLWRYLSTINKFGEVSRVKTVVAIFDFLLSVYLAYKFKVMGLIIGTSLTYIVAICIICGRREFRPSFLWDIKDSLSLMYLGMPLFLIGLIYQLLTSIDRIVIVRFLDNQQLGIYGIALIAFNMFNLLSLPSSHVIYPRVIEEFSRSQFTITDTFKKYILIPAEVLSYLIAPAAAIAYFFLPLFIAKFLPLYMLSINPIMILVAGAYFLNLMNIFSFAIVTIRKYKAYFAVFFVAIIINLILNLNLVKRGYGITGVAFANAISYCILSTIIIKYVLSLFKFRFYDSLYFIIRLYLPLLFSILTCGLISKVVANRLSAGDLSSAFICIFLYFCGYIGFIWLCGRQRIMSELKFIIKEISPDFSS